jgi:hypothetical protein
MPPGQMVGPPACKIRPDCRPPSLTWGCATGCIRWDRLASVPVVVRMGGQLFRCGPGANQSMRTTGSVVTGGRLRGWRAYLLHMASSSGPRPLPVAGTQTGLTAGWDTSHMAAEAVYGFVGVLLGSATTAVLTVYRERLVSSRERDARQHQREQDRKDQRDDFQRQSMVSLQDAVSDLVKAVFDEQERMLEERGETGRWPARQWETPTATGWVDAELRLQVSRARVFDEVLRNLARDIRAVGMKAVWASSLDESKQLTPELEQLNEDFNKRVRDALRNLF